MSFTSGTNQNIYNPATLSYNCLEQKKNTEDNLLSFVGISMYNNGIIAFCDSKSTRIDGLGNAIEDKGRNVKKMLFGKDYILLCYNANQYISSENNIELVKNIEDYLALLIKEYSYLDLLFDFNNMVNLNPKNKNNKYSFIIGSRDIFGWYYTIAEVWDGKVTFEKKERESRYAWGGTPLYHQAASDPVFFQTQEGYKELREIIRNLYLQAESIGTYNPAGFPFHFAIQTDNGLQLETVNNYIDL